MIRWPFVIVADLAASLAAVFLAPFAAMVANKTRGTLPVGLRWMETPDCPLPGDLREPQVAAVYQRFGWRACAAYWLARNKAYAFSMRFAFRPADADDRWYHGEPRVGDDIGQPHGWCWFAIGSAREFYMVRRLVGNIGIRVRVGYKLQPFFTTPLDQWPSDWSRSPWGMPVLHLSIRRLH